ncbi:uncharacterized protein A4U43_C07F23850 [Asparagus officinalis]|uniref:F-box domain-containing protein n=1 Tax=Asparagus officinalis TaxID=4686 RepID=A0A5P1EEE8_ASPOF|nr:F-box/kelch-repeat protein At5g42350-like [Asparagus officinalis]ONK64266.1 uncharacterized protein A4U43_C07F23850 [Asparagus officinalis]
MESSSFSKRSQSSNGKSSSIKDSRNFNEILSLTDASLGRKMGTLGVSKRLLRNFSQNLKKKNKKNRKRDDLGSFLIEERALERPSSNCFSLYIKGGGCSRVGSCEEIDINSLRKLSISEDCLPAKAIEKRNSRKSKALEPEISLPTDVIERILVRLPLKTLVSSRLVCRKWNQMIISPYFARLRSRCGYNNPWLFLFGLTRKGVHLGEVFALDVGEDCWYVIRNELLEERVLYSVASIGMDVYIVGGRTGLRTHEGVLMFSPLTNTWNEISPMKVARSESVLGVFEMSSNCSIFQKRKNRQSQNRLKFKTRNCGVSEVYEDPHRFSLRRQFRDAFNESPSSVETRREPSKVDVQQVNNQPKFALIVVGGVGSLSEPLRSGEIYDPATDNWTEISGLPEELGSVSSGAVCNGKFYVYSFVSNKIASYDLERGFWVLIHTSQPPLCIRPYRPKLVSCTNRLFMCCVCWSEGDEQVARKLFELDTVANYWSEVSRHPDAPMDKYATFVAVGERIYGLDMFRVFGQALDFLTACNVSNDEMGWSRVTRKHAGHEACDFSCRTKSMVILNL